MRHTKNIPLTEHEVLRILHLLRRADPQKDDDDKLIRLLNSEITHWMQGR
jgi:hypothetical protein